MKLNQKQLNLAHSVARKQLQIRQRRSAKALFLNALCSKALQSNLLA